MTANTNLSSSTWGERLMWKVRTNRERSDKYNVGSLRARSYRTYRFAQKTTTHHPQPCREWHTAADAAFQFASHQSGHLPRAPYDFLVVAVENFHRAFVNGAERPAPAAVPNGPRAPIGRAIREGPSADVPSPALPKSGSSPLSECVRTAAPSRVVRAGCPIRHLPRS